MHKQLVTLQRERKTGHITSYDPFSVKVCESDCVALWDGTVMRRSLAERRLLEGNYKCH